MGFAEELCVLAVERCEAADGAFPTMDDCEELAFWCAELGYDESQCEMSYTYCVSMAP